MRKSRRIGLNAILKSVSMKCVRDPGHPLYVGAKIIVPESPISAENYQLLRDALENGQPIGLVIVLP